MSRYIDVDKIQERICKRVNNPAIFAAMGKGKRMNEVSQIY